MPDARLDNPPIVRVTELGKAYSPGQYAIRGVNLAVAPGELAAIIGRSGAGKSTLLRCLNLLIRPTEGRIELRGVDITGASGARLREVRGRVGMIFQGFNLVRRLSVLQNVAVGRLRFRRGPFAGVLAACRWLPRHDLEHAYECLERVGIGHLAYRRADALSGGQQQRVAIARVLAQEPEVILADEPIASLDPLSARGVMETLRTIQRTRGIPVLVNLHQVEVAREFSTRIIGMAGGGIAFDVPSEDLSDHAAERLYRQPTGAPQLAQPVIETNMSARAAAPAGAV